MQRNADRTPICVRFVNDCDWRICRIYCRIAVFIDYRIIRKYDFSGIPTGVVLDGKHSRFARAFTVYRNNMLACRIRTAYFRSRFYIAYNFEI